MIKTLKVDEPPLQNYFIISRESILELILCVNQAMEEEGFRPVGGVRIYCDDPMGKHLFMQAVFRHA